jgi:hypothetical protein
MNARFGFALLAAAAVAIGSGCPLQSVQISEPKRSSLHDDASIAVDVKVGRNHVAASAVVRVDGVDLAAALGLTPPFAGAGGNVVVGADVVAVSDFTYDIPPTGNIVVTATLTGLGTGDHTLEAEAAKAGGGTTLKSNAFAVVEPFTLEADVVASAGTPPPPAVVVGNRAGDVVLGESLAAPPVPLANGAGELRAGFVPAAQGRAGSF